MKQGYQTENEHVSWLTKIQYKLQVFILFIFIKNEKKYPSLDN